MDLSMGGYGLYVWSALGLTLSVTLLIVWLPMRQHKVLKQTLKKRLEIG